MERMEKSGSYSAMLPSLNQACFGSYLILPGYVLALGIAWVDPVVVLVLIPLVDYAQRDFRGVFIAFPDITDMDFKLFVEMIQFLQYCN